MIHFTLPMRNKPSPSTAVLLAVSDDLLTDGRRRSRGGTLSGELHTDPLLVLHVTVGYLWSHTRSWPPVAGLHDKADQSCTL